MGKNTKKNSILKLIVWITYIDIICDPCHAMIHFQLNNKVTREFTSISIVILL